MTTEVNAGQVRGPMQITFAHSVAAARLDNLILVVYRGLAVGNALEQLTDAVGASRVVWFADKPRAGVVLRVAEECGRVAL